jgi:hypothetical protein
VAAIVAEQVVVADFGEARGQHVQPEAPDELAAGQRQGFEAVGIGVILVGEGEGAQAAIGDGHAVGVAAQVVQDGVGSDDRALGEDDPAASAHLAQQGREGAGVLEEFKMAVELEFAGGVEGEDPVKMADGQQGAPLLLEPLAAAAHYL